MSPSIRYNDPQSFYNNNGFPWKNSVDMKGLPLNNNNNRNTNSQAPMPNYSGPYPINSQSESTIPQRSIQMDTSNIPAGTPVVPPVQISGNTNPNAYITSPYTNGTESTQYKAQTPASNNANPNNNNNKRRSFMSRNLSQGTKRPKQEPLQFSLLSYPIRKYISNLAILKFYDMFNMINNAGNSVNKLEYWQKFVKEMFAPYATIRYSKASDIDFRKFDFLVALLPLIFITLWKFGVVRMEMSPGQIKCEMLSNGRIFVSCPRATFAYHYSDASYITHLVQLRGIFNSFLKLEFCDLYMHCFVPGIEWNSLERLLSNQQASYEIFQKLSKSNNNEINNISTNSNHADDKSKNKTKNNSNNNETLDLADESHNNNPNELNHDKSNNHNRRASNNGKGNLNNSNGIGSKDKNIPPNFDAITQLRSYFAVFRNVSVFGSQEGLMRVMQVSTVMSALKNLRAYQKIHGIDSPLKALEGYVQKNYNSSHPMMSSMGNNNDDGKNSNQMNSKINNSDSPRHSTNSNINSKVNLNSNNPYIHNSYPYTETPRFSTNNQVSDKRSITSEDNGISNDKINNNSTMHQNNKESTLKRRRESGISPHSSKDILFENMNNGNNNDAFTFTSNDNYYNMNKKSKN